MTELAFRDISLEDRGAVEEILREVDSSSCQHSFPNLWCLREKYGTQLCIRDGILYIRQTRRREFGRIAYFAPLGAKAGYDSIKAVERCAKEDDTPFYLFGITEASKGFVKLCLDAGYHVEADRDWCEYLYGAERLRRLSGSGLSHRRRDVCAFWRQYEGRACVEAVGRNNLEEVMEFQHRWQQEHVLRNREPEQLEGEHRSILNGLEHFEELGLRGVAIRIDGAIAGYGYGAFLGRNIFDIIAQKADYRYRNGNQALFRELAVCAPEAESINYEEDIGLAGLRHAKLSYKPEHLLPKFSAVPAGGVYE